MSLGPTAAAPSDEAVAIPAKPRCPAAAPLAAALPCAPAQADGSAAALDAGGLVLLPEPGIALAGGDLSIWLDRIDVSCVLRNPVDEPRTVRIAFPLPRIDGRRLGASALTLPQVEPALEARPRASAR